MSVLSKIRSAEWWEYKLPPLLALGYATALKSDKPFLDTIPQLLFLLFSLAIGATYVSIINDITDLETDLASQKKNRMSDVSVYWRRSLPLFCLLIGAGCCYYLSPDWLSVAFYIGPWISFSLYSFKPFRLKDKGIWGVLADTSGSHISTSLLMISSISYTTDQKIQFFWIISTGIWAICYGLRGILWHQFYDRKHDLIAGVNTFAISRKPEEFRKKEICLFAVEITALACMLSYISLILPFVFLAAYLLLCLLRSYRLGYQAVIIVCSQERYYILMADFYQAFFPVALLITAAFTWQYSWIVLVVHLILFPQRSINALKDFRMGFKKMISK